MFAKPAWSQSGRTGPVRKFQNLVVFACEGLIAVCDERPQYEGEFVVVTPEDMRQRINACDQPYRNQTRSELPKWQQQEYDAIKRGCAALDECIKEAKAMGDPSDPAVQAWWRRHRRQSTISLSAGTDAKGYPKLPDIDLGPLTGRTANIDGQAKRVSGKHSRHHPPQPQLTGGKLIHQPPRKKNRSGLIEL